MHDTIEAMLADYECGRLTRRQLVAHLAGLAAAVAGVGGPTSDAQESEGDSPATPTFRATGVDHVALRVTDVPRSADFYRRHLGLEPSGRCSRQSCFLDCGPDFLALFAGPDPGLDHFSFAVEGYQAGSAVEALNAAGLDPDRRGNRVYFRDPDGIEVQVSAG